jgi:cytochrome subunit of sulfide dehydrogenase
VLGGLALALTGANVGAAPTEPGRDVAATCAACHGTDGRSRGGVPSLAGRNKNELVQAMRAFRDGQRPSTIMQQLAKGYSDAEIEAAAAYFADQKAP